MAELRPGLPLPTSTTTTIHELESDHGYSEELEKQIHKVTLEQWQTIDSPAIRASSPAELHSWSVGSTEAIVKATHDCRDLVLAYASFVCGTRGLRHGSLKARSATSEMEATSEMVQSEVPTRLPS